MEKTYKEKFDMWQLDTDQGHILHKVGSDDYTEIRHTHVKPSELDKWEEIAVADIPPYTKAEYDAEVERLIALRYSHGKEVEINRERTEKPERFAAYMAYVEQCKAEARQSLAAAKVGQAAAGAFAKARGESEAGV